MNDEHVPGGYAILARVIQDSWIWREADDGMFKMFAYLILSASHTNIHGLKRGQLRTSYRDIARACGHWERGRFKMWGVATVKRWLDELETDKAISVEVGNRTGTVITVLNYDTYQNAKTYVRNKCGTGELDLACSLDRLRLALYHEKVTADKMELFGAMIIGAGQGIIDDARHLRATGKHRHIYKDKHFEDSA